MDGVIHEPTPASAGARDRRPLPGSRAFCSTSGPATIICGTRSGIAAFRQRASSLPQHYLMAPTDVDPGSVRWPMEKGAGVVVHVCGAPDEFVTRLTQALLADGAEDRKS